MLKKLTTAANIINFLQAGFLYKRAVRSFSLITVWFCNFLAQEYWRKSWSENVGEIDARILTQKKSDLSKAAEDIPYDRYKEVQTKPQVNFSGP